MYKVGINGVEKEIEAAGMTVDNGTILFIKEDGQPGVNCVVPAGKWDYLEVGEGSDALQIRQTSGVPQDQQAGSGEEVREAQQEHPAVAKAREEEAQQLKQDCEVVPEGEEA